MKKLDLTKIRAGQTVYLISGDNIRKKRDWEFEVVKLLVDNAPLCMFYEDPIRGYKISRLELNYSVTCNSVHKRGADFFCSN